MKRKPALIPRVYVEVEVGGDGETNVTRVHANCTIHTPEAPTKCPWARFHVTPPAPGDECAFYGGGDCSCPEIQREGMRRIRDYIDAALDDRPEGGEA